MADVVVFGCGPAGLIAAWAVEQAGHNPVILSRKEKSVIPGSMYLHEPIPGISPPYPENTVLYTRIGTAEGYALKVYGDETRETGWQNYATIYPSWNVQAVYDSLWFHYEDKIEDFNVGIGNLHQLIKDERKVISTIPSPHFCHNNSHSFNSSPYWIKTLPTPQEDKSRDVVVYNGLDSDPWYRWSILSGICSIEYPFGPDEHKDPTFWWDATSSDIIKEGRKAIDNNCDCWPEVVRAGRWAEWRHGVLLHDAYHTAVKAMEGI